MVGMHIISTDDAFTLTYQATKAMETMKVMKARNATQAMKVMKARPSPPKEAAVAAKAPKAMKAKAATPAPDTSAVAKHNRYIEQRHKEELAYWKARLDAAENIDSGGAQPSTPRGGVGRHETGRHRAPSRACRRVIECVSE